MVPKLRRNIGIFQAVEPGEGIPRGWGVAWIEPGGWTAICFPYGLHIVMRWLRLLYEGVMIPRKTWWEKRLLDAGDVGYERGVVIGKSMGGITREDCNKRIAVAVGENNAVQREPIDEAWARGYRIGWEAALVKIENLADMDADQRRKLIEEREALMAKRVAGDVEVDPNEAQAERAERSRLGKPWDPRGHY